MPRLPSPSVSTLLRTLGVTKQALNGPLRDLYAQKLITFTRAATDARVKQLSLTPEGRKLEGRLSALQRAQSGTHRVGLVRRSDDHDATHPTAVVLGKRESY